MDLHCAESCKFCTFPLARSFLSAPPRSSPQVERVPASARGGRQAFQDVVGCHLGFHSMSRSVDYMDYVIPWPVSHSHLSLEGKSSLSRLRASAGASCFPQPPLLASADWVIAASIRNTALNSCSDRPAFPNAPSLPLSFHSLNNQKPSRLFADVTSPIFLGFVHGIGRRLHALHHADILTEATSLSCALGMKMKNQKSSGESISHAACARERPLPGRARLLCYHTHPCCTPDKRLGV